MRWKVGQRVKCMVPTPVNGCFVHSSDAYGITIFCPNAGMLIYGKQTQLETKGWMLDE